MLVEQHHKCSAATEAAVSSKSRSAKRQHQYSNRKHSHNAITRPSALCLTCLHSQQQHHDPTPGRRTACEQAQPEQQLLLLCCTQCLLIPCQPRCHAVCVPPPSYVPRTITCTGQLGDRAWLCDVDSAVRLTRAADVLALQVAGQPISRLQVLGVLGVSLWLLALSTQHHARHPLQVPAVLAAKEGTLTLLPTQEPQLNLGSGRGASLRAQAHGTDCSSTQV
jgi:hypothetical protein